MNNNQLPDPTFFPREIDSHSLHTNPYPNIQHPNQLIPHQHQISHNWQNLQQNQHIHQQQQQHHPFAALPQIQLQNNQFHSHQPWQQSQQQQHLQNQFIPPAPFDQQQRPPFDPQQQQQQRTPFDVQHQQQQQQQILHHPHQIALLNTPVPLSSFADQAVVKALIESTQRGVSYKQALEALHGIGGHGGHMWKDYYLDSATRLNQLINHYSTDRQNSVQPRSRNDYPQAQHGQQQQKDKHDQTAASSTKQPQSGSRSHLERKSTSNATPSNSLSKKRNTLNSMTAHTAVFTDKLPPPHAEIKIPDPPSRSPTPPTKTVVKGGRNLYTQEDRDYFIKFLTWSLKKDPDLTRQELCEMLAEKVPSHTAASWASHWSSRHDIADKIMNSYAGIETGDSFSDPDEGEDGDDDDDDDDEPPISRGTRSRSGRLRKQPASISAPVRKTGRTLRARNRRRDSSSEEGQDDSDDSQEEAQSDPPPPPPRRRGRPRKKPLTPPVKVKAEPLSDMDGDLRDADGSEDDSDISLDGFDPGDSSEDVKNMGETGGPYSAADLRIVGRHVATTKGWAGLGQKGRWGSFAEKYTARTAKSWAEYYRRNENAINTYAAKYRKYKTTHKNGRQDKPQSITQQKGRPSWATGNAPKRKFNPDINSGEGEARRKLGRVDRDQPVTSAPPTSASASASSTATQHI